MNKNIVRCISCDGYGWFEDDFTGETEECDWCDGIGYVYRAEDGVDSKIPKEDYGRVADTLEDLERQRLREMGYQGEAKRPWEQDIREGTKGGANPYEEDE
jgi:hypothetical protein